MSNSQQRPKKFGKAGIVIIGAAVIVFALVISNYIGYPPSEDDATGAIGAAKKYQAEQITDADVNLDNPELQALLQDDKVLEILENEEFQRALRNEHFRAVLADEALRGIIATEEFSRIMNQEHFRKSMESADFARLWKGENARAFASPQAVSILNDENARAQLANTEIA